MAFDLFYAWRWLLMLVCAVYAAVRMGQSIWRWHGHLWSGGRSKAVIRRYLFLQFLRLRVHRFTLELLQIAALVALLGIVSWAHRFV